jgi:hypothetical protein
MLVCCTSVCDNRLEAAGGIGRISRQAPVDWLAAVSAAAAFRVKDPLYPVAWLDSCWIEAAHMCRRDAAVYDYCHL